jgi:hypothetical protein
MSECLSNRSRARGAFSACAALTWLGLAGTGCAMDSMADEPDGPDEAAIDEGLEGNPATTLAFGFEPVEPCLSESDYVSRGAVRFGLSHEPFTPPCVRLASGGTVIFQGSLAEHPIVPRQLGTAPSPIQPTSSGSRVEFEFPDYGTFPYRCARHPEEIGVVWSSWQ